MDVEEGSAKNSTEPGKKRASGERTKKSVDKNRTHSSRSDAMEAEETGAEESDEQDAIGADEKASSTEKEAFASVRVDKGWVAEKYQKLLQTYGSILQQLDLSVDKQKKRFRVTLNLMFKGIVECA